MPRAGARRRLATVLFLDIVGSTALANEIGDARWRNVLARFRRIVRAELRRYDGREQDTAGDGFFATFAEPAQALRCAAAIAAAVQEVGLDVRAGVHTGECEEIDGKLGGIAVHIGARVMGLAGAAEVLATSTAKDLVAGSGAAFEERGTHDLKGVEGSWRVFALRSVDVPLPAPLTPAVAAERLASVAGMREGRRWWPVALVAALAVIAALISFVAVGHGTGATGTPPMLVKLDARTGKVVDEVRDGTEGCPCGANLWAIDGTLWEHIGAGGQALAQRNLHTGAVRLTVKTPSDNFAIGFGSVWVARQAVALTGPNAGSTSSELERVDELSGRTTAKITLPSTADGGAVATGNGAVWVMLGNATLLRVDPGTNHITGTYRTGAIETGILVAVAGYEWICECVAHKVLRYDARTHSAKTFHFAQQPWHLVGVDGPKARTLWLLDGTGATITQIDPQSGHASEPLGLSGHPWAAVIADNSIWVAAGTVVDKVSLATDDRTTITLPRGIHATGIAVDPQTNAVWVDDSFPVTTGF